MNPDHIREEGKKARDRVSERTNGGRATGADWAPEILRFDQLGWTTRQICLALKLGDRRVRQIRSETNKSGMVIPTIANVKRPSHWDSDTTAMMQFTADGFELFYSKFSGFDSLNPLHKSWVSDFVEHRNLMLNVPPRHGKSHIFSVWVPLWLICMDRNHQILVCSAGGDLLKKLLRELFYHLESNQSLIATFGRFQPEKGGGVWRPAQGEAVVLGRTLDTKSGQFSIQVRGAGQDILGTEATCVVVDDCTDPKITRSPTENTKRMNWLREEVFSRLEPTIPGGAYGKVVVVGQRVGMTDIYGQLAEQKDEMGVAKGQLSWHHILYPAVLTWPEENQPPEVLWPDKWSFEQLLFKYNDMGRAAFMCMYQQQPLDPENAWVKKEWLERIRDYERVAGKGVRQDTDPQLPVVRVISIDPSPKQWNAMTVADVVATRDSFSAIILEMDTWKGGTNEFQEKLDGAISRYRPDYFILESSTATKWLEGDQYFQSLRTRVTCITHNTGSNKHHEEYGTNSLAADIEAGRISTPFGDLLARTQTEEFERQAELYGHGTQDDILMSLWFIKWNWKYLRPKNAFRNSFKGAESSWNYLRREKQRTSKDDIVKKWRQLHGSKR